MSFTMITWFLSTALKIKTLLHGHRFSGYDLKTEDFYEDIADDVPAGFDTSGYCPNRPLPVGLNKKVIGLMKYELGGKMTE